MSCPQQKKEILDGKKVLLKSYRSITDIFVAFPRVVFTFILIFFSHVAIFFSSSSTAVSALGGQEGTFHSPQPNLHFRHTENPGSLATSAHTPPCNTLPSPTPPASNPTSFSPRAEDRQPWKESVSPKQVKAAVFASPLPSPASSLILLNLLLLLRRDQQTRELPKFSLKTVHGQPHKMGT